MRSKIAFSLLFYWISALYFPFFHLSLFLPLLFFLTDQSNISKAIAAALFFGLFLDSISFSYPYPFYTIDFLLLSTVFYYAKSNLSFVNPVFTLSFLYATTVANTITLSFLSVFFGRMLSYTFLNALFDFILVPLLDTLYAGVVCIALPALVELILRKKFFIEFFRKRYIQKKVHKGS